MLPAWTLRRDRHLETIDSDATEFIDLLIEIKRNSFVMIYMFIIKDVEYYQLQGEGYKI